MRMLALALAAAPALAACAAAQGTDTVGVLVQDAPPAELTVVGEGDSVWTYLAGKYDADGDGLVSRAEYDRDDATFERLDRDADGSLAASDFTSERSRMPSPSMMAPMVLMRYFQDDEDRDELRRAEVSARFTALDSNADGRLLASEFDAAAGGRAAMMPGMDRFGALLAVADADDDKALSAEELFAWFDEQDEDGNGTWTMGGPRGGAGRGNRPRGSGADAATEPEALAAEGRVAPDFTLPPLHGGEPVTLSSFAGKRPVALVFGSYT